MGIPFTIHDLISLDHKRSWNRIYPRTLRNFSISTYKLPLTYKYFSLFCSTSIYMWTMLNITTHTELKIRKKQSIFKDKHFQIMSTSVILFVVHLIMFPNHLPRHVKLYGMRYNCIWDNIVKYCTLEYFLIKIYYNLYI